MSARLLITGIGLLAFGLANFFRYLPITYSPLLWNKPFPFEYISNVTALEGAWSIHLEIYHIPLDAAANDPYWLLWSLTFYAGILITGLGVWRR